MIRAAGDLANCCVNIEVDAHGVLDYATIGCDSG